MTQETPESPNLEKSLEKLDLEGLMVLQMLLARRALDVLKDTKTEIKPLQANKIIKPPVILLQ